MSRSDVPRNASRIKHALDRALGDLDVPTGDWQKIVRYINRELPRFYQRDVTTYLVLGSYRGAYGRRLREFANELNMPHGAAAVVLGDTHDPDTSLQIDFDIKFHLLAEHADYIAGVYEKESGGESPELGLIRGLYHRKFYCYPRDYVGLAHETLDTRGNVIAAAIEIYYAEQRHLSEPELRAKKREQLLSLLAAAQANGIALSEQELTDILLDREASTPAPTATYSWVHVECFRWFELYGRCFAWFTLAELLKLADTLPGPARPRWEHEFSPDDVSE